MSRFLLLLSLCLLMAPPISFAAKESNIPRKDLYRCFSVGEFIQSIGVLRDAGLPLGNALLRHWAANPPESPAMESAQQGIAGRAYALSTYTPEQLYDHVVVICLQQALTRAPDRKL